MKAPRKRGTKETKPKAIEPFTLPHFREWASELILDTRQPWVLEPFQASFVEDLFAGTPECWLIVPEGNAKTTLAAGLALYHARFTPDGWVPVAAASRDQARILYRQAKGFVSRSEILKGFTCFDGYRRIDFKANGSQIEIFAADERTGDGIIPSLCIVDELHRHRTLDLYNTWRGKLEKRGGQIVAISTAGEPGSEFEETRETIRQSAVKVDRTETFVRAWSPNLLLHEWAVPEKGDTADFELVKRANPLKAITIDLLKRKWESPTTNLQHWRRFVCNLPTRSENAAIQEAEWHAAISDEQIPPGVPIWVGLDLAWKWDTTAVVPLYFKDSHFRLLGPATVLVPPRDGSSLDPNKVEKALIDIHHRNPIHTLVLDPNVGGEQMGEWAQQELGCAVVARSQANQFAAQDYTCFMEALKNGWLRHTGDRALTQHVLHAVARVLPDGRARFDRPSQTRQGGDQDRRVIDALSAAAMVHTTLATLESAPFAGIAFA